MPDCDKHDVTMDRIFNKLNNIENNNTRIISKLESVEGFVALAHKVIYGNGQSGIVTKVANNIKQIGLQWSVIIILLGSGVGMLIHLLLKAVK